MRLFLIALVVVIFSSVAFSTYFLSKPGYVLISYQGYAFETSFAFAASAFTVLFFSAIAAIEIGRRLLSKRYGPRYWLNTRDSAAAKEKTRQGFIELAQGDWKKAELLLVQGAKNAEVPLVNLLRAAEAADAQGETERRDQHLSQATQLDDEQSELAIGLTRAQLQYQRGQWESCVATLTELRKKSVYNTQLLNLLQQVYVSQENWDALVELLPSLKKYKVISASDYQTLEVKAHQEILRKLAENGKVGENTGNQRIKLEAAWDHVPKALRRDAQFIAIYCRQLIAVEAGDKAQSIIESNLKHEWSEILIDVYSEISDANVQQRFNKAKGWLNSHGDCSVLLATLGRLAVALDELAEAKEFYKSSLAIRQNSSVSVALGKLLAQLGEHEESNQYLMAVVG